MSAAECSEPVALLLHRRRSTAQCGGGGGVRPVLQRDVVGWGVWYPKECVPEMAQIQFSFSKFDFFSHSKTSVGGLRVSRGHPVRWSVS